MPARLPGRSRLRPNHVSCVRPGSGSIMSATRRLSSPRPRGRSRCMGRCRPGDGRAETRPRAASARMNLACVRSDTTLVSRAFSFCGHLGCLSWPVPIPPSCRLQQAWVCAAMCTSRTPSTRATPCPKNTSARRSFAPNSSRLSPSCAVPAPPYVNHRSGTVQMRWRQLNALCVAFQTGPEGQRSMVATERAGALSVGDARSATYKPTSSGDEGRGSAPRLRHRPV